MPSSIRARRRSRLFAASAATAVALVAAACSSASSTPTTTGSGGSSSTTSGAPVTLRLGYLSNLTHAAALVGLQQGTFAKYLGSNVTLQTSTFNAGPAEVTALLAGSLDAAYMGPNSAITAYSQGAEVHPDHLRSHLRGRRLRGRAGDHLGRPAQGQDGGQPAAREHPGRGAADLAHQTGAHLPGTRRRERRGHHPARGQRHHPGLVRGRHDRRGLGARTVGDPDGQRRPRPRPGQREDPLAQRPVLDDPARGHARASSPPTPRSSPTCSRVSWPRPPSSTPPPPRHRPTPTPSWPP